MKRPMRRTASVRFESSGRERRSGLAEVVLRIRAAAGGPSGSGSLGVYDEKQHLGVCVLCVFYIRAFSDIHQK